MEGVPVINETKEGSMVYVKRRSVCNDSYWSFRLIDDNDNNGNLICISKRMC